MLLAGLAALVVALGAAVANGAGDEPSTAASDAVPAAPSTTVYGSELAPPVITSTPPSPTATTTAPVDPQVEATEELGALREDALAGLSLDGRFVAQVASKYVGITDPLQTAQDGSHVFQATDILAESLGARRLVSDPDSVLVLLSTDFGSSVTGPSGQAFWVTLVDLGFSDADSVRAWCDSTFSALGSAERENACAVRTLSAPS